MLLTDNFEIVDTGEPVQIQAEPAPKAEVWPTPAGMKTAKPVQETKFTSEATYKGFKEGDKVSFSGLDDLSKFEETVKG